MGAGQSAGMNAASLRENPAPPVLRRPHLQEVSALPARPANAAAQAPPAAPVDGCWRFGGFVLWAAQRRLERHGQPVRMGFRTFELLLQLLLRAGEVVDKHALLATAWAGVVVEETSVRTHMSLLRKALGEPAAGDGCAEWITSIPLRGYRFNGRVRFESAAPAGAAVSAAPATTPPFAALPVRLTRLVGREVDLQRIDAALDSARLVTLVGTGGIGKTSAAIHAAQALARQQAMPVAFADLSPLSAGEHVLSTVARALGVASDMADPQQAIVQRLAGLDLLLLVDNCEQVVESVAPLMASLLAALPGLRVLATSREALRVEGERVLRLSPLPVPPPAPDTEALTLDDALRAPAVQLLVERSAAAGAGAFHASDGALLATVSRQTDGIPLAIELVAARLGVQPLADLALQLDDHMRMVKLDKRAVQPRQRTLAATLAWSTALLSDTELQLFRRLSVFRGRFDVASALGVARGDLDPDLAFEALISLANQSLLAFDSTDAIAPYRLLLTTRAYAATLLAGDAERERLQQRHAQCMLGLMQAATADLQTLNERAWAERYAFRLDDVRCALDFCLRGQPDAKAAAALVVASTPLWFSVSQVETYRDNLLATLALLAQQDAHDSETAAWLNTSLVSALLHTDAPAATTAAACDRALAGALATPVQALELRARWGRCTHDMFRGAYAPALAQAETLHTVVQGWADPLALSLSHRVSAMAHFFRGEFAVSRQHSEASLAISTGVGRSFGTMVGPDPVVAAQAVLCRTLWVQGEDVAALAMARDTVARAEAQGSALSLCAALYGACPVALWAGETALAQHWVQRMVDETRRKGLAGWHRYAMWFLDGVQLASAPDPARLVRQVHARMGADEPPHRELLVTLCLDWLHDGLLARVQQGEPLWNAAEVWRAAGWRHAQDGRIAEAEVVYRRAIATAQQQGARGWERRATASLAALHRRQPQ